MTTKLDLDKVREAISEAERLPFSSNPMDYIHFVGGDAHNSIMSAARAYLALVSGEPSDAIVTAALKAFYHGTDLSDIGDLKAAKRDMRAALSAALKVENDP